jgi:hypothetical protein
VSNFYQLRQGFGYLDELDAQMRLPTTEMETDAAENVDGNNEGGEAEAPISEASAKQLGVQFRKKDPKHPHGQEVKDDEPFQKMEFYDMKVNFCDFVSLIWKSMESSNVFEKLFFGNSQYNDIQERMMTKTEYLDEINPVQQFADQQKV